MPWQKLGKVLWFQEEPDSLIGRAEVFDAKAGVAGSFSCFCPCNCLLVIEAMKTQTTVYAPIAGKIVERFANVGETVDAKDLLLLIE